MVTAYLVLLGLIAIERGVELAISRRNAKWALAQGGIEVGREHFPWMKRLHAAFFVGCALEAVWLERPFVPGLAAAMLALILASQALRYWAIGTLGRYWNVRVIVVPGAPAVATGPYRWLRHPNYLAVVVEGIAIPLLHGAWITALVFTALNAWLLSVRIRCEEAALATHCEYGARLGDRSRFVPRLGDH